MAIDVYLQDVNGRKIDQVIDVEDCLSKVWPCCDKKFPLMQYIDPYGNTMFNGLQMKQLQTEIDMLLVAELASGQKQLLQRVRELAVRCQDMPQTHLRFSGD